MDERTLEALRGSVAKWQQIVDGEGMDLGTYNCPLCLEFYDGEESGDCDGCPVAAKTGTQYCNRTPYEDLELNMKPRETYTEVDVEGARRELEFLKSLLPEDAR